MKNRTKSALTLVVALIAFVFVSPRAAYAISQPQVATVAYLSMNSGSSSVVNFNSAKCGASNTKTVQKNKQSKCGSKGTQATKMSKKGATSKCGSKGANATKMTKKGATSKCGSKADSTKMKAKKAQGKCGQGKCGGGL